MPEPQRTITDLRFLQERQSFRVGSLQVRGVDVRFGCAGNRDPSVASDKSA